MSREKASIEFTYLNESGVEISYDRRNRLITIEGWYNYLEPLDKFEIPLEELLKLLEIPVDDIKSAYHEDCWGRKVKKPGPKKRPKNPGYKKKKQELFKWHRKDKRPSYEITCAWQECGKVFVSTDQDRKFCCRECSNEWFKWQNATGERQRKAAITLKKKREIAKRLMEGRKKKKEEKNNE